MSKRERIFNFFSRNLTWIAEHPNVRFEPSFSDSYLCPICFSLFPRNSLFIKGPKELTLEHIIPNSLGGSDKILTCRACNSKAGHSIDSSLLAYLEETDFMQMQPKAKKRILIEKDGEQTNAFLEFDRNQVMNFLVNTSKANPISSKRLLENMFKPRDNEISLKFNFRVKSVGRAASVALLKIAYLKAFKFFGNGFMLNPALELLRKQISNPTEVIIAEPIGITFNEELPLGLSVITAPIELRSFLVTFELRTKSNRHLFSIMLPGFSDPGVNIYGNLKKKNVINSVLFNMKILTDPNYVSLKEDAFASQQIWNSLFNESNVTDLL